MITIGAHGVKSPANESFTPVRFTRVYDAAPAGEAQDSAPTDTTAGAPADTPADTSAGTPATPATRKKAATAGVPTVRTDRLTAKVGNTLAFTATGFTAGEQVIGVLDDGAAGIGPLVAGPSGEVAGILPLPATLPAGTHESRLTGAASGGRASERFAVRAADRPATTAAVATSEEDPSAARTFLVVAGALFVLAVLGAGTRLLLRRRRPAGALA
ncbi:hypothetical protein G5V59_23730 [Nocardioides sp. W3-2-3]|uniref:hypothetical protein n=1 Tax=Nocardioides convexus TaxID=2712224 RepID=UPI0024181D10|nr:hypothetical protein [Nocardioides convexus]NHA01712.1 hypothetical protein [Nocardioides convexus]